VKAAARLFQVVLAETGFLKASQAKAQHREATPLLSPYQQRVYNRPMANNDC